MALAQGLSLLVKVEELSKFLKIDHYPRSRMKEQGLQQLHIDNRREMSLIEQIDKEQQNKAKDLALSSVTSLKAHWYELLSPLLEINTLCLSEKWGRVMAKVRKKRAPVSSSISTLFDLFRSLNLF